MDKPSDVLINAQNILRASGWCRGVYKWGTGECCSLGVIREASGMEMTLQVPDVACGTGVYSFKSENAAYRRAANVLADALGFLTHSDILAWNDSRDDIAEVLAAFDRAIELAKMSEYVAEVRAR